MDRTLKQVAHLRSTQRAGSQIMMCFHQVIPETGEGAFLLSTRTNLISPNVLNRQRSHSISGRNRGTLLPEPQPNCESLARQRDNPPRCNFSKATRQLISFGLPLGLFQLSHSQTRNDKARRDIVGSDSMVARIRSQISSLNSWPHIHTPIYSTFFSLCPATQLMGHVELTMGKGRVGEDHSCPPFMYIKVSEILNQDQDDTFRISSSGSNSLFCNCLHHLFEEITARDAKTSSLMWASTSTS